MKSEADRDTDEARRVVCTTCMWWEEPVQYILVAGREGQVAVVCADCLGTGLPDARSRLCALLLRSEKKQGEQTP